MNIFKKPLKKSHNEKISGVCAGLVKSLEIDVSWVRLFFVLFWTVWCWFSRLHNISYCFRI